MMYLFIRANCALVSLFSEEFFLLSQCIQHNAFLFICVMKIDANIFWLHLPFKFHMSKVLTLKFNHVTVVLLYCYSLIQLSCLHFPKISVKFTIFFC